MSDKFLTVSSSPHIRGKQTTQIIMRDVLIALIPASALAVVFFGYKALILIAVGIVSSVLSELAIQKILKRTVTVNDCSAAVTGLLLALNMPVNLPWWILVIGCVFAIVVVKETFGGLGCNFVNPALTARLLIVASWPTQITGTAFIPLDAAAQATPLEGITKLLGSEPVSQATETMLPSLMNMFTGSGVYGSIGEVSAAALLIGGVYLIWRQVITWRIPVVYIGTVAVFSFIAGSSAGLDFSFTAYNVLSGGLFLGAIFMATDYVTSPNTPLGEIIFAVGCGLLTCVIRFYGGYPEGVSYSIVFFNLVAPLIDKMVRPKKFGEVKKNA